MAKILDQDRHMVIIKLTMSEYNNIKKHHLVNDDISEYELVFEKPVLAKDLLKAF